MIKLAITNKRLQHYKLKPGILNVHHNPEATAAMTAPTCTGISNNYYFPVIKNTGKKQNSCAYIMHVHIKPLFIPGTPNTKKILSSIQSNNFLTLAIIQGKHSRTG